MAISRDTRATDTRSLGYPDRIRTQRASLICLVVEPQAPLQGEPEWRLIAGASGAKCARVNRICTAARASRKASNETKGLAPGSSMRSLTRFAASSGPNAARSTDNTSSTAELAVSRMNSVRAQTVLSLVKGRREQPYWLARPAAAGGFPLPLHSPAPAAALPRTAAWPAGIFPVSSL